VRPRILIAGGYGLVGGLVARHLRTAGHDADLILAGRNPEAGEPLARELGARAGRLDVHDPTADLAAIGPVDLIVAALQDPGDSLIAAALNSGAAHIGITRGADSLTPTVMRVSAARASRPIVPLAHWQAGVLTLAALQAAETFASIERIELAALYDYADPIGPMTVADSASFVGRAVTRQAGRWVWLEASDHPRRVERAGSPAFDALPLGVLDVPGLGAVTDAQDIRFDLGTGDSLGTLAGGAASHDMYIDLTGRLASGRTATRRTTVSDPKGQAHLTALGVLICAERVLGLDGAPPPPGGLAFPETLIHPAAAAARLASFGVRIEIEP
jgi:uncharacterized protein YbjT (DUF2867 family)